MLMDEPLDLKGIIGWKEQKITFLCRGRNLRNLQYEDNTLLQHANILAMFQGILVFCKRRERAVDKNTCTEGFSLQNHCESLEFFTLLYVLQNVLYIF
jgi:hypothetical protein